MTVLRRLFARLFAMLRPARAPAQARGNAAAHVPISSFHRRFPGRTPAQDLRRNLGWVAVLPARSHRDRRA
ncbi:hypothetical protein FNB15_05190 [Ferrovibrio terrae]|uniref:Uncharacterized protein n=2 Tax=Ferrovibrio terrae TaxID=2594003 RepID=A0A516GYV5_9PROT|nr:hypothetical protein FNB15_05190 [Ferrovibrio terrae]